jgi:hypothetical protein
MCFFKFQFGGGRGSWWAALPLWVCPYMRAQRIVEIPDRKTMQETIHQEEDYLV